MATARLSWIAIIAPAFTLGACTEPESATELDPEGPPMVREVFMLEVTPSSPNGANALAYGTHPKAVELGIKHKVQTAVPLTGQKIRVVMDELLVGNYLEEIACNAIVDTDQYQQVPDGTTPDDIAACATAIDVLPTTCVGEHAVCIGPNGPVGILDEDDDGTSDDTQFIDGAVGIACTGVNGAIDVPLDLQGSYWQPSGNQLVPATGGLNALGPAIVLKALHGLPTGATCSIVFSDNIIDKAGNTVCAPQWGTDGAPDSLDAWPPSVACTPGDTSDIAFGIDALKVTGTSPAMNQMNFPKVKTTGCTPSPCSYAELSLNFNAEMDPTSVANATLTPTPAGAITSLSGTAARTVLIHVEGGLTPSTAYTLTVPSPKDYYGQPLAAPITVNFTSGP